MSEKLPPVSSAAQDLPHTHQPEIYSRCCRQNTLDQAEPIAELSGEPACGNALKTVAANEKGADAGRASTSFFINQISLKVSGSLNFFQVGYEFDGQARGNRT